MFWLTVSEIQGHLALFLQDLVRQSREYVVEQSGSLHGGQKPRRVTGDTAYPPEALNRLPLTSPHLLKFPPPPNGTTARPHTPKA